MRGCGSSGPPGSALEPPSSSEESDASGAIIGSSCRKGIHSIRPASGIFTNPANSRIQSHSGISQRWYYCGVQSQRPNALSALAARIGDCRRCPRLVAWREQVARERRAAFAEEEYWGRPVAGFGDPAARILLLGLAPAAHGANRTGRVFTGDRSGDFLFAALWRTGFANQALSRSRDDGLRLSDAWVTAAVRCAPPANRPTPAERERCLPWSVSELELLDELRVVVCLGAFAWDAALRLSSVLAAPGAVARRPRPRFGHGAEVAGEPYSLIGCYHPSQQNTFTGRLTEPMIDAVLERARSLAEIER
jgi:uracil-DNA glycosylase family 4